MYQVLQSAVCRSHWNLVASHFRSACLRDGCELASGICLSLFSLQSVRDQYKISFSPLPLCFLLPFHHHHLRYCSFFHLERSPTALQSLNQRIITLSDPRS